MRYFATRTSYFKVNDSKRLSDIVSCIPGAQLLTNTKDEFAIASNESILTMYSQDYSQTEYSTISELQAILCESYAFSITEIIGNNLNTIDSTLHIVSKDKHDLFVSSEMARDNIVKNSSLNERQIMLSY